MGAVGVRRCCFGAWIFASVAEVCVGCFALVLVRLRRLFFFLSIGNCGSWFGDWGLGAFFLFFLRFLWFGFGNGIWLHRFGDFFGIGFGVFFSF